MRPRKEMSRFAVKQRENLNIYWKILVIQPKNTAENENPKKSPRLLPTEPIKSCKLRTKTSSMMTFCMTFIPIEIQDISVFLVYYIYFFNHVTIPLQRNLWLSKSVPGPVISEFLPAESTRRWNRLITNLRIIWCPELFRNLYLKARVIK